MSERVHVVGIGGIGTSAIAVLSAQASTVVSGSEDSRTTLAGELLERFPQIRVYHGYLGGASGRRGQGGAFGGGRTG